MAARLRVGVIGVGRIGVFHAQTLQALEGVSSVTVTDSATAEDLRERIGAAIAHEFGRRSLDTLSDWLDHVERELESKRDERDPRAGARGRP